MRLYPDIPRRRLNVAASDALVVAMLALFAWAGFAVHDTVDQLAVLGTGVREAGTSFEGAFDSAADSLEGAPLIGGTLGDALRGAGAGTGGNVADAGRAGEDAVHDLALILGLTTFVIPALLLLTRYVPSRVSLTRRLTAATQVLKADASPERRQALAMRAAFSLPYGQLLEFTRDPLGDLIAKRYDPLIAAALDDAGLRPIAVLPNREALR
jgi:hypothetical protein